MEPSHGVETRETQIPMQGQGQGVLPPGIAAPPESEPSTGEGNPSQAPSQSGACPAFIEIQYALGLIP